MPSDHLSRTARNRIRYHIRATEQGIARQYGISVAMVRDIRRRGQPDHPARVAAKTRRLIRQAQHAGMVTRQEVPAVTAKRPKGQHEDHAHLHTEGGVDLPQVLG